VLTFGTESTDGRLSAPKVWSNQKRRTSGAPRLGAGGGPGEMSRKARRDQGEIVGCFGAEGAVRRSTWLLQTCKGGTVRGRDKGPRVKVYRPYEDTLEACTTRGVTVMPL
jgi:hypothetical protein